MFTKLQMQKQSKSKPEKYKWSQFAKKNGFFLETIRD